ncbi:MAG: hypothetical protein CW338_06020 [Clostridiales bacterium]|nr:hypothetical protein [Clostridiales bacterium]
MDRDRLEELLRGDSLTDEQTVEIERILMEDAAGECALLPGLMKYHRILITTNGYVTNKHIHQTTYAYITGIENSHPELNNYLVYLYNREAEYFTFLNSSNEALYYAQRILDLEDVPAVYYASAVICILNILVNAKLFDGLWMYAERIKFLLEDDSIEAPYRDILRLALLDCCAFAGNRESFNEIAPVLRKERAEMSDDDLLAATIDIHLTICAFSLPGFSESLSDAELLGEFDRLVSYIGSSHGVMDSLEALMMPVFRAVRGKMSREDFIGRVLKIIAAGICKSDSIAYYEYLINECGITRQEYPDVFNAYFDLLREYNGIRNDAEKQSIRILFFENKMKKRYIEAANRDKLTGLLSGFAYYSNLAKLTPSDDLILVIADVNRMKYINDHYGHPEGDRALVTAADRLRACFGDLGDIYHFGGDEFCVIARCSEEDILSAIEKLNRAEQEEFLPGFCLALSAGYAKYADYRDEPPASLVKFADTNMYREKERYYIKNGFERRN